MPKSQGNLGASELDSREANSEPQTMHRLWHCPKVTDRDDNMKENELKCKL